MTNRRVRPSRLGGRSEPLRNFDRIRKITSTTRSYDFSLNGAIGLLLVHNCKPPSLLDKFPLPPSWFAFISCR